MTSCQTLKPTWPPVARDAPSGHSANGPTSAGSRPLQQEDRDVGDDEGGGDGGHGRSGGGGNGAGATRILPDREPTGGIAVSKVPARAPSSRRPPGALTCDTLTVDAHAALPPAPLPPGARPPRGAGHRGPVDRLHDARGEGARAHVPRRQKGDAGWYRRHARTTVQDVYLPVSATARRAAHPRLVVAGRQSRCAGRLSTCTACAGT